MQQLQYEVLSVQARDLLPVLLALVDDCQLEAETFCVDFRYTPASTEATLFQHFTAMWCCRFLGMSRASAGENVLPLHADGLFDDGAYRGRSHTAISHLILVAGRSKKVARTAGPPKWRSRSRLFPGRNSIRFTLSIDFSAPPWWPVARVQIKPIAMPGCHATPFQGHLMTTATRETTFAPTYHFVTDLGTMRHGRICRVAPVRIGFSQWYKTDIPRWIAGEYKRFAPNGTNNATP